MMRKITGHIREINAGELNKFVTEEITLKRRFAAMRSNNEFIVVGYDPDLSEFSEEQSASPEAQLDRTQKLLEFLNKGISSRSFSGQLQVAAMKLMQKLKLDIVDLDERISGTRKDYDLIAANLEKKMHLGK